MKRIIPQFVRNVHSLNDWGLFVLSCVVLFLALAVGTGLISGVQLLAEEPPIAVAGEGDARILQKPDGRHVLTASRTPVKSDVQKSKSHGLTESLVSSVGALALVLCAFLGLVFLTKKFTPQRRRTISKTLEIIDSSFMDAKNALVTIKWGEKLILVAKTPTGMTPLSEITEEPAVRAFLKQTDVHDEQGDAMTSERWFEKLSEKIVRVKNEKQNR